MRMKRLRDWARAIRRDIVTVRIAAPGFFALLLPIYQLDVLCRTFARSAASSILSGCLILGLSSSGSLPAPFGLRFFGGTGGSGLDFDSTGILL
jgi:hypothetical protein